MQPDVQHDILAEIIAHRKVDLEKGGVTFGCTVPVERHRPVVPFLPQPGTILEIKRASPSKGMIVPDLDAVKTAQLYLQAGTTAISVLTEQNYFCGSLNDLVAVSDAAGTKAAVLRKDFLLDPDEIAVAYRCGADAVLLIARILTIDTLLACACQAFIYGITVLLELRGESDIEKAFVVMSLAHTYSADNRFIVGINARDLASFKIDLLAPFELCRKLGNTYDTFKEKNVIPFPRIVSESGITTVTAASFIAGSGFHGVLIGEAAVRDPDSAGNLVRAFCAAYGTGIRSGNSFWEKLAVLFTGNKRRPIVKICGITTIEDALAASIYGADILGFVFSAESPRRTTAGIVQDIRSALDRKKASGELHAMPLLVGVITDRNSVLGRKAEQLAVSGILDGIQYHACGADNQRGYPVVRVAGDDDITATNSLFKAGFPRVLIDAFVSGVYGGTGTQIAAPLIMQAARLGPLWLAGGIDSENVGTIIETYHPELIDVSSGVESSPGRKDIKKLAALFASVGRHHE
jgi:indole-3-glycerol phosphate synthase / phosphoribosylanthranilate isomerase